MNYGIKEIEEFKAPSGKPWLVIAILVLAAIIVWQSIRLWQGRAREPKRDIPAANVESTEASQPDEPVAVVELKTPHRLPTEEKSIPKPPVNLKAEDVVEVAGSVRENVKRAQDLRSKGARVPARELLLAMLGGQLSQRERADVEKILADVNISLALLPYDMPEKITHVVQRGDSLDKMSKKYGVTVESIQIGNALKNPNLIKAGDHLRVLDADFSIDVYKGSHELVLLMNGKFFKRYKVGLGKFDKTPLGTFEIYDRIVKPVWWRPDGKEIPFGHKENILGTRWMAIRATGATPPVRGYGIHGTWDEGSIGKSESAGCVRMRNADVEELFNLVPLGTKVTILQ